MDHEPMCDTHKQMTRISTAPEFQAAMEQAARQCPVCMDLRGKPFEIKKVYISGPIMHATGPDQFGPAKAWLAEKGYLSLNPKDVQGCQDRTCILLPHESAKGMEHSWACFMKYDLIAMLQECDAIMLLDGWQDSHGARLEMQTAAAVGMKILFAKDIA